MHEMALAESILQVVLDAAEDQRVRRVRLQLGRLRMVVPESLQFSFKLVAEGTPAEGAALEMEELPIRLCCGNCGAESRLDLPPFKCRECGVSDIEVISGDEVIVDAVELASGEMVRRREVRAAGTGADLKEHAAHTTGSPLGAQASCLHSFATPSSRQGCLRSQGDHGY